MNQTVNFFWFRRDLRLSDNAGLHHALLSSHPVVPLFVFDSTILSNLKKQDRRVEFIYSSLCELNDQLVFLGSNLVVRYGEPVEVWQQLVKEYQIEKVFANRDYEPHAKNRDASVAKFLKSKGIAFLTFKDHVFFESDEILKKSGEPYTVFTPYKNAWKKRYVDAKKITFSTGSNFIKLSTTKWPSLSEIGLKKIDTHFPSKEIDLNIIRNYDKQRDFPAIDGTSKMGIHIRFGTISIRELIRLAIELNECWLDELIWRDFFQMIIYHFPAVEKESFKKKYDSIRWINNEHDFNKWCLGQTGYPIVDAGMRQLNSTGYMHNRVRMITASFLCKHLLIDWRWGERYFAEKLLDYDLAANNGNWQWAASTGCDAVPYFRIFNPYLQTKKFDPKHEYIKKWVPEYSTSMYPAPIIDHNFARVRALKTYKYIRQICNIN